MFKHLLPAIGATLLLAALAGAASAQDASGLESLFKKGPLTGNLGGHAEMKVPEGFAFADAAGTRKFLEMNENIPSGTELGTVLSMEQGWFLVFEFDDCGYVKDDEKASLDADAMMKSMMEANIEGNKERAKRGWKPVNLVGWTTPPHYDEATHNLEWGRRLKSEEGESVNYDIRLLGRNGVMKVILVAGPKEMDTALPQVRKMLAGYTFKEGQKYAEYRQGDKIAKYGLSALVVGGAAAAAAKFGLFKYLGKFIILIGIAIAAGFKKIVGLFRRNDA
jgi:uncharacterized membrane-anchored protein